MFDTLTEDKRKAGEEAVKTLLNCFGVNIENREGMAETPKRVIKMLEDVWAGEAYTNEQIANLYNKTFVCNDNDLVVVKDIETFSYCEHHLALIYDMKISIGYIPKDKVIGISKLARIADMCSKRLQLQERIGEDIADVLARIVGNDVIVKIEANHSCMTARGIKKPSAKTVTFTRKGIFQQQEYFNMFINALR